MLAVYPTVAVRRRTYGLLIVEPTDSSFLPHNWRQKPESYRVINRFDFNRLGEADTKKFIFNKIAIDQGSAQKRWAVSV